MRFTTKRLSLRELSVQDLDGFARLKMDAKVTGGYYCAPLDFTQSKLKLMSLIRDSFEDRSYTYAIFEKAGNAFVGTIVLWNLEPENKTGEVGYELLPDFWGKGYAKEVLPAFLSHMHRSFGYEIFTACPATANIASNRVLAGSGFVFAGSFMRDGHTFNDYRFDITAGRPEGKRRKDSIYSPVP